MKFGRVCTITPSSAESFTNKIYLNPGDEVFGSPHTFTQNSGEKQIYVEVSHSREAVSFVFLCESHTLVEEGSVALNRMQRKLLRISTKKTANFSVYTKAIKNLISMTIKITPYSKQLVQEAYDAELLASQVADEYAKQIFDIGYQFPLSAEGTTLIATVTGLQDITNKEVKRGKLTSESNIYLDNADGVKLTNTTSQASKKQLLMKSVNFEDMGIGGLGNQLNKIFRRAFSSRMYNPELVKKLGIKHVKGIILHGPPGTGKTLIARQIGKLLNCKKPKVVNGPSILSKFVGESEKNIRELFSDASQEYDEKGEDSELHLIIFDEIDAICKRRGTVRSGTGVNDSVVNQLLSMIDGVNSLNNVLIIGMTNRLDMLDEALLRPGRFEVQMEIGLPDEKGRKQIFNIHTKRLVENKALNKDVEIDELSSNTPNYSGAEIEGVVRCAMSYAFARCIDIEKGTNADLKDVDVNMNDFENALEEVKPAFGVDQDEFKEFTDQKLFKVSSKHDRIQITLQNLTTQLKNGKNNLITALLEGNRGTGKSSLAAYAAVRSEFSCVKLVSAMNMVGFSESAICSRITKIFNDAYKTPLSVIVIDDLERLIGFVKIGPRFSNNVLQLLLTLIKKQPPEGRKMLVIATTSAWYNIKELEFDGLFNTTIHVPCVNDVDSVRSVLQQSTALEDEALFKQMVAVTPLNVGIKILLFVVDTAKAIGDMTLENYMQCLTDCGLEINIE